MSAEVLRLVGRGLAGLVVLDFASVRKAARMVRFHRAFRLKRVDL